MQETARILMFTGPRSDNTETSVKGGAAVVTKMTDWFDWKRSNFSIDNTNCRASAEEVDMARSRVIDFLRQQGNLFAKKAELYWSFDSLFVVIDFEKNGDNIHLPVNLWVKSITRGLSIKMR